MAIGRHVRQGDVVLIEVPSSMIEGLRRRESRVIAYGEATGHWHDVEGSDVAVLDAPALSDGDGQRSVDRPLHHLGVSGVDDVAGNGEVIPKRQHVAIALDDDNPGLRLLADNGVA